MEKNSIQESYDNNKTATTGHKYNITLILYNPLTTTNYTNNDKTDMTNQNIIQKSQINYKTN